MPQKWVVKNLWMRSPCYVSRLELETNHQLAAGNRAVRRLKMMMFTGILTWPFLCQRPSKRIAAPPAVPPLTRSLMAPTTLSQNAVVQTKSRF